MFPFSATTLIDLFDATSKLRQSFDLGLFDVVRWFRSASHPDKYVVSEVAVGCQELVKRRCCFSR